MEVIWEIFTSKFAGPIAAGLAVLLLVMLGITRVELAGSRHHAESLEASISTPVTGWAARLATCQANTLSLKGAVAAQNAAVDALRAESEARVAASARATSAARSVAESYRQQAAVILAAKPTSADACVSAQQLISQTIQ